MAFTPIETQEQFDAAIKERLQRERESQAKKFEGWVSPDDFQKLVAERDAKIKQLEDAATDTAQKLADKDSEIAASAKYRTDLEKTKIAIAAGLKIDYADRLRGETAEEWKADAELLAKDFGAAHLTAPLGSPEPAGSNKQNTSKQFADWFSENFN